jgi:predicted RNA methylase
MTTAMPLVPKQAVREALRGAGYSHFEDDYRFDFGFPSTDAVGLAALVAFWRKPPDQFASAVAVQWIGDGRPANAYLMAAAQGLWAPFTILAHPDRCALWETLPAHPVTGQTPFVLLEENLTYDALGRALAEKRQQLGPQVVAQRKQRWRQLALYEASREPNAFIQWAFRPTWERLADIFKRLLEAARATIAPEQELESEHLRWLLRMIGVRIGWDKQWMDPGDRTSGAAILEGARRYPTTTWEPDGPLPSSVDALADLVASDLGAVHLGAADGGLLSRIIQGGGLPEHLQKQWKLYPTPPDIAWHMLEGLPLEAIPENQRSIWDGTCGTGTILVAALDRLRSLAGDREGLDLRNFVVSSLSGNEREPVLADATRIALDLALGARAGPEWRITLKDVKQAALDTKPTVIASNPPFGSKGRTPNMAIPILKAYLDCLDNGSLLSVIAPRTILASESATALRRQLLEGFDLLEVWTLPGKVFPQTDVEAAVLLARKRWRFSSAPGAVTWRTLSRKRDRETIDAADQRDWMSDASKAIVPPLALRLRSHFAPFPKLREYAPKPRRTQGITPGTEGRGDVLSGYEPGAEPYLVGRTGVVPFYIPWQNNPRWIRYSSPDLQWPRRAYEQVFRMPKVLVTRETTWGHAWRVRAAVDRQSLFPSDPFIAVVPEPPLSLEFVAALLNSALINAWLALSNPSFDTRISDLLGVPIPSKYGPPLVKQVESLARHLADVRARSGSDAQRGYVDAGQLLSDLKGSTLKLDALVYDLYAVPMSLRKEIGEYLYDFGGPRPGFEEPVVETWPQAGGQPDMIFSEHDRERLDALFALREERELVPSEERELAALVERWQHATRLISSSLAPADGRDSLAGTVGVPSPH